MGFRADAATRAAIVKWSKNEPDKPSLSEAIRRLVDLGLARGKGRLPSTERVREGRSNSQQRHLIAWSTPRHRPNKWPIEGSGC